MSSYNLDARLQTQEVYLDSQYATLNNTNGENSNVYFFLNAPISVPNDHDIVLRIDNFVLPISFFVINNETNSLVVNSVPYTIPVGNYNAIDLKTELDALLPTITVSFDENNNKFTFTSASPFTLNSSSTCFRKLGFSENTNHVAVLVGPDYVLTSDFVCNLAGTSLVYIDIPNLTTKNISSRNGGGYTSIIKSVVVDVPYGAILTYTNNTNSAVVLKEKYISFFQIRLLDDQYKLLDLNNQNFTLTLELFFYYNGQQVLTGDNLIDAVRQQEEIKRNLLNKQNNG